MSDYLRYALKHSPTGVCQLLAALSMAFVLLVCPDAMTAWVVAVWAIAVVVMAGIYSIACDALIASFKERDAARDTK